MLHDAVTPCIVNIFLVFISMHITSFFCQLLIPVAYVSNAIAHLFTAWILFHPINFRRHTNLCLRRCSSLACSFVIPLRSRMFFTCLFFQSFLRDSITLYNANVIIVFLFNFFLLYLVILSLSGTVSCLFSDLLSHTSWAHIDIDTKTTDHVH